MGDPNGHEKDEGDSIVETPHKYHGIKILSRVGKLLSLICWWIFKKDHTSNGIIEENSNMKMERTMSNNIWRLKQSMMKGPILSLYDFTKTFEVQTNASDFALGGVLVQKVHPIVYESCKLLEAEMNYTTYGSILHGHTWPSI